MKIWKIFPHLGFIISGMLLTFAIIDLYNPAMEFMTSDLTKRLMLTFAVVSMVNSVLLMIRQNRDED